MRRFSSSSIWRRSLTAVPIPRRFVVCSSVTLKSRAVFCPTKPNRVPPQLIKFIVNAGAVLLQAFYVAYRKEAARGEYTYETSTSSSATPAVMSDAEAIQVLGLEQANPQLLVDAKASRKVLPLTNPRDIEVARRNFDRMLGITTKHENLYLTGKLSLAYRLCVDPEWDKGSDNPTKDAS